MAGTAFVVAHFDPKGVLRDDLLELVRALKEASGTVVFVSTGLNDEGLAKLEPFASVIVRENVGYDFYSYKVGLESLGNLSRFNEVVILNSSFLCLDPKRLISKFTAHPRVKNQLLGITKSDEYSEHVQSYFIAFPNEVVAADYFKEWWASVESINKREDVIKLYEIGISTYFLKHGCTLGTLFEVTSERRAKAESLFRKTYRREPDASVSNPTHFNWDDLAEEVGIIKIELVARNPHGIDLSSFYKTYGVSHKEPQGIKSTLKSFKRTIFRLVGRG